MPELWKCADGSEMFCGRSTNNALIAVLLAAEILPVMNFGLAGLSKI